MDGVACVDARDMSVAGEYARQQHTDCRIRGQKKTTSVAGWPATAKGSSRITEEHAHGVQIWDIPV